MFNMGFTEMIAVAIIALVVIGPKQLPQVARVLGRILGEFRRATGDFQREIYRAEENVHEQMHRVREAVKFDVKELYGETETVSPQAEPSLAVSEPKKPGEEPG